MHDKGLISRRIISDLTTISCRLRSYYNFPDIIGLARVCSIVLALEIVRKLVSVHVSQCVLIVELV